MKLEAKVLETTDNALSRPEILAHAPFIFEEALKKDKVNVEDTTAAKNHVEGELNIGAAKFSSGHETTHIAARHSIHKYFSKGASAITVVFDGKRSGVWWNVKQSSIPDAQDDAGIDPNYRFAVLLTRGKDDKEVFKVKICLEIHAGIEYLVENRWKHVIEAESLSVDPRVWYVGDCRGIDRRRLEEFEMRGKLTDLTKK